MSQAQELLPLRPQDIVCQDREDWLTHRHEVIGASEAPTILGCGYANQNQWSIWRGKTSPMFVESQEGEEDEEDEEEGRFDKGLLKKMLIGTRMEPVLRTLFADEAGVEMFPDRPFTIRRHPEHQFMGATLDGLALHPEYGLIVGELKNVSAMNAGEWRDDEAPLKYEVQLQQQLAVTGCQWGVLVGLIGGETLVLRWRERNERFQELLLQYLRRFWALVQTGIPPAPDSASITGKILQQMHPDDDGTVVALPDEATLWHATRTEMKALKKSAEEKIKQCDNALKMAIGDATYGLLPDGSCYSWKTVERKGYVREVLPSKSRTLRDHKALPRGIIYQPPLPEVSEPVETAGLLTGVN